MNTILQIRTKYSNGLEVVRFVDDVAIDDGKFSGFSADQDRTRAIVFVDGDSRMESVERAILSEDLSDTDRASVEVSKLNTVGRLAITFRGRPDIESSEGEHTLWIKEIDEDSYGAGTSQDAIELTQVEIDRVLGWLHEDAATDEYPFLKAEIV